MAVMAATPTGSIDSPLRPTSPYIRMIGPLRIDLSRHEVHVDGQPVSLSRKEWELLTILAVSPRRLFSNSELFEMIWGSPNLKGRAIVTIAYRLRRKIGPEFVHAVHGFGYRLLATPPEPGPEHHEFVITDTSEFRVRAKDAEEARAIYLDKGGEFLQIVEIAVAS